MLKCVLSGLLTCCLLLACGEINSGAGFVPRNRSLIMNCTPPNTCAGQIQDYDSFNPFLPGSISSTGHNFLYEPLYFYNPYGEEQNLIPWIATGHEYNDDFTEVTIYLRDGVKWSDGTPWTAADLVFTIDMLKQNAPVLNASVDMELWVAEASVVNDLQAKIALKSPNPRFVFEYLTNNFGNGIPIVPKHIWEGKDAKTFANLDIQRGWPVISGPYRLVRSEPQQRIWDLRQDWWAAEIGFRRLPRVERLIYLPYMDEDKRVQLLIDNQMDTCPWTCARPISRLSSTKIPLYPLGLAANPPTATLIGGPSPWALTISKPRLPMRKSAGPSTTPLTGSNSSRSAGRARAPIPCYPSQISRPCAASPTKSEICSPAIQSARTTQPRPQKSCSAEVGC